MRDREAHNPVCVADMAALSALGDTLEATWPRLCRGESAIAPVTRFSTERLEFHQAACIAGLEHPGFPEGGRVAELLRRVLGQLRPVPPDTRIIWTGVKGNVDFIECGHEAEKQGCLRFPYEYRELAGRILGIEPRGFEINAACASSTAGLALGAQMIASGECESVLVCAADIVSRFTFTGFSALKALSPTVCRPFDARRDGLCLGDGAAAILLASEEAAAKHHLPILARLTGWGVANDANHITGPARDAFGLIAAIRSALEQAGLPPDRVEAFSAHGTGTPYNDGMELTALETVFGPRRFPLFSIKGATGHTLGAAGALEAAVSVRALRERTVPATPQLEEPEKRAAGRAAPLPQPFAGNNILTSNSGFGGVNAALVLEC